MVEYYLVKFVFWAEAYYALWYSADTDGFYIDSTKKKILVFGTQQAAEKFVCEHGMHIHPGLTTINCDMLQCSMMHEVNCNTVLTFWNIISDVAASLNVPFLGNDRNTQIDIVYDKLFFGCNLPVIKEERPTYTPTWNLEERELLQQIIQNGLAIVKKYVI